MTHVHQIKNILIIIVWTRWKRSLSKVFTSQWIFFIPRHWVEMLKKKKKKKSDKEDIECEIVEFDHVYKTNDDADFKIWNFW